MGLKAGLRELDRTQRWSLRLQVDSICLDHTLPPTQKSPLNCADSVITSKAVFCTVFGHVVTMTFNIWLLPIFSHVVTLTFGLPCPSKCFWLTKVATWNIWMELWIQNCTFAQIWSCGNLDLWFFFSEMLNNPPASVTDSQQMLPCISEWSCGSKIAFLPIFILWWPWPLTLGFSNFLKCLTLPQQIFVMEKNCYLWPVKPKI